MYYRNPIKIMCTIRLNDGIFRVWFSVMTPAQLHKLDAVFRIYLYGGKFDNPPGYCLSARETIFGTVALMGFLDLLGLLVCFLPLFRTV
jgi:hypothetical protein